MSREVSPALSAYIVSLLEARKTEFKSQNKMATAIGIPGGSLSSLMSSKRGVGPDILGKLEEFLGKKQFELEREAGLDLSATRTFVPERHERREQRLSNVRDKLLKRWHKADVHEVISESEFVDGLSVSELEAFDRLDELLRMRKAESKGKLVVSRAKPDDDSASFNKPALDHLESVKQRIAKSTTAATAKRTRK